MYLSVLLDNLALYNIRMNHNVAARKNVYIHVRNVQSLLTIVAHNVYNMHKYILLYVSELPGVFFVEV